MSFQMFRFVGDDAGGDPDASFGAKRWCVAGVREADGDRYRSEGISVAGRSEQISHRTSFGVKQLRSNNRQNLR